ncbi:Uncharacterized protein HSRCO_2567 [Halanaeroarchaeum sp. HSR-CO]|uniref:DUF7113 family protein n=1 Tax=Halanaeroarchaeum sp. HSR-CO TaxID=2866382 RepID=UPI00217D9074|nr:hypothetical protein [Halanaeroarchaeum sp. HSR-CO]UWG48829.1 Uncharacterized protein HSRCO_2567 [Halanaeroarchaeum sp. HSR-CO]
MKLVQGSAAGTALTGTLYEPGDDPPRFAGAPTEDAAYVFVCDAFYEVESGGVPQQVGGRELRVAFETPFSRGFDTKEGALEAAREHIRTQFSRIGVERSAVEISVLPEHEI